MEAGKQDVRLEAGRVVKRFERDLAIEACKHQRLAQLGQAHGFYVPELLAQDAEQGTEQDAGRDAEQGAGRDAEKGGTLSYEYIAELVSCREYYLDYSLRGADAGRDEWQERLFGTIGKILAIIHRELRVEPQTAWHVPPIFDRVVQHFRGVETDVLLGTTPHAVLHGDFGFSNVCSSRDNPQRLVLIDPSPNFYSSFACNERASVYLDISKFSVCLRGLVPRRSYFRLRRHRADRLRDLFLKGYQRESGWEIDTSTLDIVERAQLACKMRYEMRRGWKRIAAAIMLFGWNDGRIVGKIANAK